MTDNNIFPNNHYNPIDIEVEQEIPIENVPIIDTAYKKSSFIEVLLRNDNKATIKIMTTEQKKIFFGVLLSILLI